MAEVTTESPSVPKNPWGSPHRVQPPSTISTLQLGQAPGTPFHRSQPCPLAHCSQNSHSGPCLQRSQPVPSTSLHGASQPLSEQETHSSQLCGDLGVRAPSYCWSVLRPSGSLRRDLGRPLPGPSKTSRVWRVGVSEAAQHSGLGDPVDPGDPPPWGRQTGPFRLGLSLLLACDLGPQTPRNLGCFAEETQKLAQGWAVGASYSPSSPSTCPSPTPGQVPAKPCRDQENVRPNRKAGSTSWLAGVF